MSFLDKVTQGPCEVRNEDTVVGPLGNVVAECCGYKEPTGDREKYGCRNANAVLFAGAFELARAAQEVVECWESGDLAVAVRELDNVLRQIEAEA